MSISDGCANPEAKLVLRPIVSLTETLPKKDLEPIVVEAILRHRFLRDVAELRLRECRTEASCGDKRGVAHPDYVRAMIECHAQQVCLSTLIDVLGYVPHVVGEQ